MKLSKTLFTIFDRLAGSVSHKMELREKEKITALNRAGTKRISDPQFLQLTMKAKIAQLEIELSNHSIPVFIFETIRTAKRQKLLRRKGVSKIKHSLHQDGWAVDFVYKDNLGWSWDTKREEVLKAYQDFGHFAIQIGLEWGYDMWGWDMPHVQMPKDGRK